MVTSLPRVVLAAPASGQGKTTVSVGVMAALAARGLQVAPAKVGPDFIDPGYHALATGRAGRNLDPWLVGPDRIAPMLLHGATTPTPADVTVIEGVMGLFDGRLGTEGFSSTAHVAMLTRSPVVLVVDISSSSRSVAASIHGLNTFEPGLDVAGVVLNKAGSTRHSDEVRRACERLGIPVLGVLPRDAGVSVPSRHLGLVPADERAAARATLERLAERTAAHIDLDALLEIASGATALDDTPWSPAPSAHSDAASTASSDASAERPVVAVAGGRAFTFRYAETLEMMSARGLDPVVFDPVRDRSLPEATRGLYLGGGFPEVHARSLAANTGLLTQLRDAVSAGIPTVAECAGMLYLLDSVDGHRFAGVLGASAAMSPRLTLGYREAEAPHDTLLTAAGTRVRGHEFHRTLTTPPAGEPGAAWLLDGRADGFSAAFGGAEPSLHASYLHTHWAGYPQMADRFARAVHEMSAVALPVSDLRRAPSLRRSTDAHRDASSGPVSTDHHGDLEIADGLVDFAVNVRASKPPRELLDALRGGLDDAARYPDAHTATDAVAAHHGVRREQVLLTNGAAEAFTLVARALMPRRPVVVHPQFSEPDAALRRAGRPAQAHVLDVTTGGRLDPHDLDEGADLVVVGNPTNPTGVLHARRDLEALRRTDRVLVVDEAFMDLVPGQSESLVGGDMQGLLVVRSLTKTWSIAGLRAGYVVGDPALIAALREQQPHWSVNSLALEATRYAMSASATRQVGEWAEETATWRDHLVAGLRARGVRVVDSSAPFVLARVGDGVHAAWRDAGFATRRADTFPGLDGTWVRLAVRDPLTTDALLTALDGIREARQVAS